MTDTLDTIQTDLTSLRAEVKALTKLVRKVRSVQDDPTGEKAAKRTINNGFNRPLDITPTLQKFLGMADGEQISRSDVTRRINKYITENNLKHPDNKRVIILDDQLTELLDPPAGMQVTFLNIQKYISPHYVKKDVVAPETESKVDEEVKKPVKRPVVKKKKET